MRKPHRWAEVIKAWADGEVIQYRLDRGSLGWDGWRPLKEGMTPTREDLFCEYRVKPKEIKKDWQREREAYLAGFPVEFRPKGTENWLRIDRELINFCQHNDPKHGNVPLWDRDWLEFQVPINVRILTANSVAHSA